MASYVDFRVNGKYYYDFFLNSTGTSFMKQLQGFIKEHAPELKAVAPANSGIGVDRQEPGISPSYIQELRELARLRDDGIISEEEFKAKKQKLLGLNGEPMPQVGIEEPRGDGTSGNPPTSPPPE